MHLHVQVNISNVTHRHRRHVHSFYEQQNSFIESLIGW